MPEVGAELNGPRPAPHGPGHDQSATAASRNATPPRPLFDFGHAFDPARLARPAHRAPRLRHRRRYGLLAALSAAALSGAGAVALSVGHQTGALDRDRLASALGFGIEQVSLTGNRFTPDTDLFDALDLKTARSLLSFDAEAIRGRFERLPWVRSVEISRVWPGELAIRVIERKAFAVWERGDTAELVDATGRVLGPVKRDAVLNLPHIAGDGANTAAAQLFTALDRHPLIKARVVRAARLGDRRWTLELAGGGRIHLPSDGEAAALARLAAEPQLADFVASPGQIIDLRSPTRIAVRNAAAAAGAGG